MSEESSGPNIQERLWRPDKELPPPLPEDIQPSRAELETYTPNWELFLKPDLPQHGIYHGASVLVWANVLLNQLPETQRDTIDRKALSIASLYHDCGRKTDYGYLTGEMQKHGPRGAEIMKEKWSLVNPDLSEESLDRIVALINDHTPTSQDRRERRFDKRSLEEYPPDELMLRVLQDADHVDLVRGYYGRKIDDPRPTVLARGSSRFRYIGGRDRAGMIKTHLQFEQTKDLLPQVDALAYRSRHDPDINRRYSGDPFGATLEAAEQLGILKA